MIINQKKLNRQLERQEKWMKQGCQGTGEACTAFGKTYEAILIIKRLHTKYPDVQVDVVVPGIDLKEQWENQVRVHSLRCTNVYVVNTYITRQHNPVLIVLDEVHRYGSEEFSKVFECAMCVPLIERKKGNPFILALTATLERIDGKHKFIEKYCPIFDTVTLEEARREGFVSQFTVYNLGLEFNKQDQEDYNKQDSIFKNAFGKFNHDFDLAMACGKGGIVESTLRVEVIKIAPDGTTYKTLETTTKSSTQWRFWYAQKQEWDGDKDSFWSPGNISKYAQQFQASMRARKNLIYTAHTKIDAIKQIYYKFKVKTIVFGENNSFADKLEEEFGNSICRAYHTDIKSEVIREQTFTKKGEVLYKNKKLGKAKTLDRIKLLFEKEDLMIIATSRKLNEGYDNDKIRLAIMAAYNSSKRDDTQRTGRAVRDDVEDIAKHALVVNLYMIGTQEEKWLKDKQKGKQGILWVTSIDDINLENQLSINLTN